MSNHLQRTNRAHKAGKRILKRRAFGREVFDGAGRYAVRRSIPHGKWFSHGFVVRHPDMPPLIHKGRKP